MFVFPKICCTVVSFVQSAFRIGFGAWNFFFSLGGIMGIPLIEFESIFFEIIIIGR